MGRPRIFGTNVANLSDETRIALKRNTGAVVVLVINDSPAFHANVLVGDIIIRIDDTPIDSEQDVTTKMPAFAGKDCVLTVLRDGKETKIPIKLNPASP
jgi:S1-C subfamily serine protease